MKQFLVFHPFLFAIFPILFLFAYNIDEVPATDLLLPMLVAIIGTLILLLSLRLLTKSYNKIAIVASYFLVLFFSYGHIRDLIYSLLIPRGVISDTLIGPVTNFSLGSLWVLFFISGAFLILKPRRDFSTSTKFLNVVAIALVAISLVNISIYEVKTANLVPEKIIDEEGSGLDLSNISNLPDIYYIILDCYTRQDVLKEFWDYDNSEFINFLTDKGFYVASKSRCNYPNTLLSLSSSLNMRYINHVADTVDTELEAGTILLKMIQDNEVSRLLKSRGYHYIYVSSGWFEGDMGKYADVYRAISTIEMTNFVTRLVRTTALAPFVYSFIGAEWRGKVLYSFDALANLPNYEEPVFVFAHICCPHGPYIFDRDGNPTKEGEGTYIDQLIFVNKKIKLVIDEILSKSDIAPIIILQGDTGQAHHGHGGMDILNAYFLSGKDNQLLYKTITPVNSFRVVFNHYFDANYDLLNDKSYSLLSRDYPYKFILLPPEGNAD